MADSVRVPRKFLEDVIKMRDVQKRFYDAGQGKARQSLLNQSKSLELKVDGWLDGLEKDLAMLNRWSGEPVEMDLADHG